MTVSPQRRLLYSCNRLARYSLWQAILRQLASTLQANTMGEPHTDQSMPNAARELPLPGHFTQERERPDDDSRVSRDHTPGSAVQPEPQPGQQHRGQQHASRHAPGASQDDPSQRFQPPQYPQQQQQWQQQHAEGAALSISERPSYPPAPSRRPLDGSPGGSGRQQKTTLEAMTPSRSGLTFEQLTDEETSVDPSARQRQETGPFRGMGHAYASPPQGYVAPAADHYAQRVLGQACAAMVSARMTQHHNEERERWHLRQQHAGGQERGQIRVDDGLRYLLRQSNGAGA